MVVFDGAANMQKADWVIAVCFPKVVVCKGIEHVWSIILIEAFKEMLLELLKTWTSIVCIILFYILFLFCFDLCHVIYLFFIAQEHVWHYITC